MAAIITVIVCVICVASFASQGGLAAWRILAVCACLVFYCWWFWAWPLVELNRNGIVVRNMIRTVLVPWKSLDRAEAKLGLYLYLKDSKIKATKVFAAGVPAKGGFSAAWRKKSPLLPDIDFSAGLTQTVSLDPASAVRLIETEALFQTGKSRRPVFGQAEQNAIDSSPDAKSRYQIKDCRVIWNWLPITIQALLLMAAIWGFFIG